MASLMNYLGFLKRGKGRSERFPTKRVRRRGKTKGFDTCRSTFAPPRACASGETGKFCFSAMLTPANPGLRFETLGKTKIWEKKPKKNPKKALVGPRERPRFWAANGPSVVCRESPSDNRPDYRMGSPLMGPTSTPPLKAPCRIPGFVISKQPKKGWGNPGPRFKGLLTRALSGSVLGETPDPGFIGPAPIMGEESGRRETCWPFRELISGVLFEVPRILSFQRFLFGHRLWYGT